jgi:hypothetical protein
MPEISPDILKCIHIPKEMKSMNLKRVLASAGCILLAISCLAQMNMSRGKAELKAGDASITVDFGQPALKGRDMLSQLKEGSFWRMGNNQATVFKTPVDLTFGSVKVPKGDYSLWLKRAAQDKFELVFNSQTGQWGMTHDTAKDVYQVPMTKETLSNSVELFIIELKGAPKGGVFSFSWGTSKLSADFQFAK